MPLKSFLLIIANVPSFVFCHYKYLVLGIVSCYPACGTHIYLEKKKICQFLTKNGVNYLKFAYLVVATFIQIKEHLWASPFVYGQLMPNALHYFGTILLKRTTEVEVDLAKNGHNCTLFLPNCA